MFLLTGGDKCCLMGCDNEGSFERDKKREMRVEGYGNKKGRELRVSRCEGYGNKKGVRVDGGGG